MKKKPLDWEIVIISSIMLMLTVVFIVSAKLAS